MRYRRPKERRTTVASAQKVSQSLGILPWNVPLAQRGQVPFPSSHLDFKGSVTEQVRQQQGDGKAAEMAVGDLIWMWPSFRPRCNGAMCLLSTSPPPPHPSPPISSPPHMSTHPNPSTQHTYFPHLPFSLSQKQQVPFFSLELVRSLFSTCYLFLSMMI